MKSKDDKRLEKTAYHEAGHAVIGFLLELEIKNVSIKEGKDHLGVVSFKLTKGFNPQEMELTHENKQLIENHIIANLAGHAAEMKFSGIENWPMASADVEGSGLLLSYIASSERQQQPYMELLKARVADMLDNHNNWSAVVAVANALLEKRGIQSEDLGKIVRYARLHPMKTPKTKELTGAEKVFIDQWIRIAMMQIEHKKRKEAEKSKMTEVED